MIPFRCASDNYNTGSAPSNNTFRLNVIRVSDQKIIPTIDGDRTHKLFDSKNSSHTQCFKMCVYIYDNNNNNNNS